MQVTLTQNRLTVLIRSCHVYIHNLNVTKDQYSFDKSSTFYKNNLVNLALILLSTITENEILKLTETRTGHIYNISRTKQVTIQ